MDFYIRLLIALTFWDDRDARIFTFICIMITYMYMSIYIHTHTYIHMYTHPYVWVKINEFAKSEPSFLDFFLTVIDVFIFNCIWLGFQKC